MNSDIKHPHMGFFLFVSFAIASVPSSVKASHNSYIGKSLQAMAVKAHKKKKSNTSPFYPPSESCRKGEKVLV